MIPFRIQAISIYILGLLFLSACKKDRGHATEAKVFGYDFYTHESPPRYFFMRYHSDNDGSDTISDNLPSNTLLDGELMLWTNSQSTISNTPIHEQLKDEAEDHQVFYQVSDSLNMTIAYADVDDNGNPIGLETVVRTGAPSSGQLTISVVHGTNKNGANVPQGDITNASGTVEFSHTFEVVIY